jgi:hypothetical protein
MIALLSLLLAGAAENLLVNPGFETGLDGWSVNAPGAAVEPAVVDGRTVARLTVPSETPVAWPNLYQQVPVKPGQLVETRVEAMGRNTRDGYGTYASLEFLDAEDKRINFEQSCAVSGDGAWSDLPLHAFAPPGATQARLCLLLNGHGEARFDNASLTRSDQAAPAPLNGPVTFDVTREVVCKSLIGFGAEDDGWFYTDENASHGVTPADWAMREGRIDWMDPDWIRMFFWYKDWNPNSDWETFTFDSPNMQSHYRTLDQYQRLSARVNAVDVEWGVADPYQDPPRVARAIGALMEHLIRDKGYTCVQDWTLSNEPNGYFMGMNYGFARFVELHRLVREEFQRRGLHVRIVGSDDTNGLTLFDQCVKDETYFQTADYFASHRYLQYTNRRLMPFFIDDRMKLLAARVPRKPFIVAEFGFQDARSGTLENPLMAEYGYAVWTAAFVIDGLNRGVAGFSIWCLHEVYYPGNGFMNYGLWEFKDKDWRPRPVYHAWAPFSRFTEPGDRVRKCVSSHPDHVRGAVVNTTLFWVNQSETPAEVIIKGLSPKEVRIMTETTLSGDRECGAVQPVDHQRFAAPPMSFGYAR